MAGVAVGLLLLCGGTVAAGILVLRRSGALEQPQPPVSQPTFVEPIDTGPVVWSPLDTGGGPLTSTWSELADDYADSTGETVQVQPVDETLLEVRFASGEAPDLFYTPGGVRLRDRVERGMVRDLTDDLADVIEKIPPGLLAPYTVDGRVYGLPYHTDAIGVWYNRSLFAQAGLDPDRPPRTWNEFLSVVDTLKRAGIAPVALAGAESWTVVYWYGCLATQVAGADAFPEAGRQRSLSENPDFLRAAQLLADFIAREPFQPNYQGATYVLDQSQLVGTGQAAMELVGSWAPAMYLPDGPAADLGWFPFPAVEGGNAADGEVYGLSQGFAVSADAPANTVDLLRFLYEKENYQRLLAADGGLIPVMAGFEVDPAVAPVMEATHAAPAVQLDLSFEMPAEVVGTLNAAMSDLLLRGASPEDTIAQVTEVWQATG